MSTYVTGLKTALLLNGTWTDISTLVYDRAVPASVTTTAGRQDETTQISPAVITGQLNNRSANFTSRNPTGTYYPYLGRNTPIRMSVAASTVALRIENDAQSYAVASDVTAFHITGNIDVRVDMWPSNYMNATLAYRWGSAKAWQFQLNGDGTLCFNWFDGSVTQTLSSTSPIPLGRITVRAALTVSSGTVTFYTAPTMGGSFTQLGNTVTIGGSTSVGAGSGQPLVVGHHSVDVGPQAIQGRIFEVQLINATPAVVADPVFSSQSDGTTSFTDAQSNSWSTQGTAEISGRAYIAHGELSELPVAWDPSGHDIWLPFQAGGIWRRLQQGNAPVLSAMRRYVSSISNVQAWWPCEDPAGSTFLTSGLGSAGKPMYVQQGTLTFASNTDLACAASLPVANTATTVGAIPVYTSGTTTAIRFLLSVPSGGDTTLSLPVIAWLTGTLGAVQINYGKGQGIILSGSGTFGETSSFIPVDGIPCLVSIELTTSGSNVSCVLNVVSAASGAVTTQSFTATAATIGLVRSIQMNANQGLATSAFGHVYVQSPMDAIATVTSPASAFEGETAGNRFWRLCQEYNVQPRIYGYPNESVVMGAQAVDTLTNLLQSCEDADRGQVYEPPDSHALGYRTVRSQVNQTAALVIDYSKAQAGDQENSPVSLTSVDDDQYTTNDWIVNRTSGTSFEAILNDGSRMSVTPPEQGGIGTYQNTKSVTVNTDAQLPDIAGWMLHISTTDQERYPSLVAGLHRPAIVSAALQPAILAVRVGDYIEIINPPAWLPPGPLQLLVAGVAHNLANALHQVSWNCVPYLPYAAVLQYDTDPYNTLNTDGSTLGTTINTSATSLSIATTGSNPPSPLWTTSAGDFPFTIIMDGEVMTVTNITGASSPQTFTVTRSTNGVVKGHTSGAAVSVYPPPVWALT